MERCRTCGNLTDDFRYIKSRTGKFNRVFDCRSRKRKRARESGRLKCAIGDGERAILEANNRYLTKPGVIECLSFLGKKGYVEDQDFRDAAKNRAKGWRTLNDERKSTMAAAYHQKNKEKIRVKLIGKMSTNPWLHLRETIRAGAHEAIKSEGDDKAGASVFYNFPYTIVQLREHLGKHPDWDPSWMSWSCLDSIYLCLCLMKDHG
jgi:hypothetical protein